MQDKQTPPGPNVTWAQFAAAATVLAIGGLAALVIVASLKGSDALATVALSLAIIAFVTQILVFIAQTWTTSQLNAETRGFLESLKASAHGTEKAVNTQVDKLTNSLLSIVESLRKQEPGSGDADLRQTVRSDVVDALVSTQATLDTVTAPDVVAPQISANDQRVIDELLSIPDEEEGLELLNILRDLSPITVANIRMLADDELRSRQLGTEPGLPLAADHPFTKKAVDAGLAEYVLSDGDDSGDQWARLTDKGRQVARLMLGAGDPPAWLRED